MYCDWLCSPDTCILWCTFDDTHDLIGHLILLLTTFITVHIRYYILDDLIVLLSYCTSSLYMHVHLSLILHTHWEFWLPVFAYPGLYILSCWSGIWGGSHVLRGTQSSLCSIIRFGYYFLSSRFINVDSLYRLDSVYSMNYSYNSDIMCRNLYVHYIACSGHFRLSVYTWDIFLAYIRRQLSPRLRSTYFGKRSVTPGRRRWTIFFLEESLGLGFWILFEWYWHHVKFSIRYLKERKLETSLHSIHYINTSLNLLLFLFYSKYNSYTARYTNHIS